MRSIRQLEAYASWTHTLHTLHGAMRLRQPPTGAGPGICGRRRHSGPRYECAAGVRAPAASAAPAVQAPGARQATR